MSRSRSLFLCSCLLIRGIDNGGTPGAECNAFSKRSPNQNSLFRSRDCLSANQGPVFSVGSRDLPSSISSTRSSSSSSSISKSPTDGDLGSTGAGGLAGDLGFTAALGGTRGAGLVGVLGGSDLKKVMDRYKWEVLSEHLLILFLERVITVV